MSTVIVNYYNELKKTVHADLIANDTIEDEYKKLFIENGDEVFLLKCRKKNPILYMRKIFLIARSKDYDIIYIHGNSGTLILELLALKNIKSKVIVHAHGVKTNHFFIHKLFKKSINSLCDLRFAASEEAGNFLFGDYDFTVIPNGISVEKYYFDSSIREKTRKRFGINENEKLIVQIGAFTFQKNYEFTIDVANYLNRNSNIIFLLVGDGPEKTSIYKKIKKLKLERIVEIHNSMPNINELLMAADGVVFPSRFEPFGIVALEAQAAGVPIAVSDKFSKKLNITELISYIPLSVKLWDQWIRDLEKRKGNKNGDYPELVKRSGYDIKENSKIMLDIFNKVV